MFKVDNMPEGFEVLSLKVRKCKTSGYTELVVTIQTPRDIAMVEIPLDNDLVGTRQIYMSSSGWTISPAFGSLQTIAWATICKSKTQK